MRNQSKKCSVSSHGFDGLNGAKRKRGSAQPQELKSAESVKSVAYSLGFDLVGIAPLGPFPEAVFYPKWLESGYAGEMKYLERQKTAKLDPESILPGARSVIVCAMNYNGAQPRTQYDRMKAWISRYAWGEDYHDVLRAGLERLVARMEASGAGPFEWKICVDTAPLLERAYARHAGLGWIGKNTCLIDQQKGEFQLQGGHLMRQQVLWNQIVMGSVNANRSYFVQAVKDLSEISRKWPDALARVITGHHPLEDYEVALTTQPKDEVKAVFDIPDV